MTSGITTIIYPVRDLAQATELFRSFLGAAPYTEAPFYVGFRVGDMEVGLDPNGHAQGMTGPVGYVDVGDINERIKQLTDAGAEVQRAPRDVGGGMLIATLADADGNVIGLRQFP